MCEGYFARLSASDKESWRKVRRLAWVIFLGYADPKKAPKDETGLWTIGDEEVKKATKGIRFSKAKSKQIAARIEQIMAAIQKQEKEYGE